MICVCGLFKKVVIPKLSVPSDKLNCRARQLFGFFLLHKIAAVAHAKRLGVPQRICGDPAFYGRRNLVVLTAHDQDGRGDLMQLCLYLAVVIILRGQLDDISEILVRKRCKILFGDIVFDHCFIKK